MTPRRLELRPGVRVTRRETGVLQVGLDAPHRVLLREEPAVLRLLRELDGAQLASCPPGAEPALRSLQAAGLVVDAAGLDRHRRELGAVAEPVYARLGDDAQTVLESRAHASVEIVARAGLDPSALVDLLTLEGVAVGGTSPTVHAVLAAGPLPRDVVDPLVRAGVPHLVVEGFAGRLRVGPFVVPGVTACLRCVDATEGERDPRRALLVEQLAADPRATLAPDPVLASWALAWAAHDLVTFLDGAQPSTWSATVTLGDGSGGGGTEARTWQRHPWCGCAWDVVTG